MLSPSKTQVYSVPLRDFNTAGVKAAKALGIDVPTSILLRADEVIE
jgi:hypothetical protein